MRDSNRKKSLFRHHHLTVKLVKHMTFNPGETILAEKERLALFASVCQPHAGPTQRVKRLLLVPQNMPLLGMKMKVKLMKLPLTGFISAR